MAACKAVVELSVVDEGAKAMAEVAIMAETAAAKDFMVLIRSYYYFGVSNARGLIPVFVETRTQLADGTHTRAPTKKRRVATTTTGRARYSSLSSFREKGPCLAVVGWRHAEAAYFELKCLGRIFDCQWFVRKRAG
jgi:hypothetical protein